MAKPSNAAKANKSHKSRSPKDGHAQSSGLGAQPDKTGGRSKEGRGNSKKGRGITQSTGNNKAFRDIKKMTKGNKSKNGCLPKLFMMFLPFIVVGAYFFLNA